MFLYYGFYGKSTKFENSGGSLKIDNYDISLAYQLSIIFFYIISLYLVSSDVMESWKKGIQIGLLSGNDLARKVFTAWDFSIGKYKTKKIRQQQIKVMLDEEIYSKQQKLEQQQKINNSIRTSYGSNLTSHADTTHNKVTDFGKYAILTVSWLCYLLILAGLGVGIWFSTDSLADVDTGATSEDFMSLWILPLIVTLTNFFMPFVLEFLSFLFKESELVDRSVLYYMTLRGYS